MPRKKQSERELRSEKNRADAKKKRDALSNSSSAAQAARGRAAQTPTAKITRLISRAETLLAESRTLRDEITKNYTAGASKLANAYGALIDDELDIARGEEAKELEAGDAPIKVIAAAYSRQTRAREFLLNLGPKVFSAMEVEGVGADASDPMVEAAKRIAQANEGDIELIRETVILKANPEEYDDDPEPNRPAIAESAGVAAGG